MMSPRTAGATSETGTSDRAAAGEAALEPASAPDTPEHPDGGIPLPRAAEDLRARYLSLLHATLTFALWDAQDGTLWAPRPAVRAVTDRLSARYGLEVVKKSSLRARAEGLDWPRLAHTMVGDRRLENLRYCVEQVIRDGVPGDLIETGVWRGGSCILMRGVLAAYGDTARTVWVADSFAGLPRPDAERYPADAGDLHHQVTVLAVSLAEVRENFRRYGLLDEQVRFLKGWFRDTLPAAPIERLAVLRLDGDMYESTMEALTALYPKLSVGGFCIIDDYGVIEGCRRAVDDFRRDHGVTEEILRIDPSGVYWRRTA